MTKYNLEDDCVNFLRQYYILKPINCPKRDKQTLRKKNKNKFFRDCQKILVTKDVDGNELKLRCATRISIYTGTWLLKSKLPLNGVFWIHIHYFLSYYLLLFHLQKIVHMLFDIKPNVILIGK